MGLDIVTKPRSNVSLFLSAQQGQLTYGFWGYTQSVNHGGMLGLFPVLADNPASPTGSPIESNFVWEVSGLNTIDGVNIYPPAFVTGPMALVFANTKSVKFNSGIRIICPTIPVLDPATNTFIGCIPDTRPFKQLLPPDFRYFKVYLYSTQGIGNGWNFTNKGFPLGQFAFGMNLVFDGY